MLIGVGVGALFGALMSLLAALDGISNNAIPGGAMLGMFTVYFVFYVKWELTRRSPGRRRISMSNRLRPLLLMATGASGFILLFAFDSYAVGMIIFWTSSVLLFSGMLEAFYRVIKLR